MVEKSGYRYEFNNIGLENLTTGIIRQAVKDYKTALRDKNLSKQEECERFFRSDWFACMTRISGDYFINRARLEVKK